MAFITVNNIVVSFATNDDVVARDSRMFEANEGLTEEIVEDMLIRETSRILSKISATAWWVDYYSALGGSTINMPQVNPTLIITNKADFTDLCVYGCMYEYILPKIANFGDEEDASFVKIGFYETKFKSLFDELIIAGDWYDFSNDGIIQDVEVRPYPSLINSDRLVRVR